MIIMTSEGACRNQLPAPVPAPKQRYQAVQYVRVLHDLQCGWLMTLYTCA
jgi:hypothetical protein